MIFFVLWNKLSLLLYLRRSAPKWGYRLTQKNTVKFSNDILPSRISVGNRSVGNCSYGRALIFSVAAVTSDTWWLLVSPPCFLSASALPFFFLSPFFSSFLSSSLCSISNTSCSPPSKSALLNSWYLSHSPVHSQCVLTISLWFRSPTKRSNYQSLLNHSIIPRLLPSTISGNTCNHRSFDKGVSV